ncbi:MAG: DNA repair protein RadA [Candidatus Magasanikbacteria bacterium]|nr:DNA repair protein RadA [Candidatus Magasanikbacteria bacterium]
MTDKNTTIFLCSNCGAQYQKWTGRCLECGKWGTVEQNTEHNKQNTNETTSHAAVKTVRLSEIKGENVKRQQTNLAEFDRVLGGGIVPGSLILLGGEPGIGKSTLAIQLAAIIPNTLYISGEESVEQIKLRADRIIAVQTHCNASLQLANETSVEKICATIAVQAHCNASQQTKSPLAIIDSIQTIHSEDASPSTGSGQAGSINQIKACAVKLLETAKSTNTAIIIVGHVTKDGEVAGPKTLEHLVDVVLYLEGERYLNRLHVLTAVLQKRAGLNLAQYDIHLNVVGGITADEPAADLAVCLAIASAYKDKKLGADLAVFGEVGLGGEVRGVTQVEKRIRECEKLGMKRVITHLNTGVPKHLNTKTIDVKNIQELIKQT